MVIPTPYTHTHMLSLSVYRFVPAAYKYLEETFAHGSKSHWRCEARPAVQLSVVLAAGQHNTHAHALTNTHTHVVVVSAKSNLRRRANNATFDFGLSFMCPVDKDSLWLGSTKLLIESAWHTQAYTRTHACMFDVKYKKYLPDLIFDVVELVCQESHLAAIPLSTIDSIRNVI